MLLPIILAGGFGDRLWPLSRENHPKQFLALLKDDETLLQQTLNRLPQDALPPVIVCQEAHRFIVAEQLRAQNIQPSAILLESARKNTAPATALAAHFAKARFPEATLFILPADHVIQETARFHQALKIAEPTATTDYLVTFGIKPTHAETGFGYIKMGEQLPENPLYQIESFIEKPDFKKATQFLNSKTYLWNSGLFLFQPTVYLDALAQTHPEIVEHTAQAFAQATLDQDFIRPNQDHYKRCEAISIDYAVMEKTNRGVVLPVKMTCHDIGNFESLWQIKHKDQFGNATRGKTHLLKTQNCFVHSEKRLIATLGVEDLIIIETPDALLVAHRDSAQAIKTLVQSLKEKKQEQATTHHKTQRPWGYFEILAEQQHFKVKRLQIDPKKSLSLQQHQHRNEHWVVVEGIATVTCGSKKFTLHQNQSTYIPKKTQHRIENLDTSPLTVIEVQSGSYLGEDDIIRFADHYGRAQLDPHATSH